MPDVVEQHNRRLQVFGTAMLASVAIYGGVVHFLPPPTSPLAQGSHFLWIFAALSVLNLVTVMPVYRAMLAGPRRVYAVGRQLGALLTAHLTAHTVAFARLEAVAVLGLVLYVLTGRSDWFWVFAAVAVAGILVLWPNRAKIDALVSERQAIQPTGP